MGPTTPPPIADVTPAIQVWAAQARRRKWEEQLVADSEKLQVLSAELKKAIGTGSANSLPADAMKKAEEMEKLSRSLKKRLKDGP